MSRLFAPGVAALSAIGLMICAHALEAAPATTQPIAAAPATQPSIAMLGPATQPAVAITPDAEKLLDSMKGAYASLKGLQVSGSISTNFDVDGNAKKEQIQFSAIYSASGKFRSELPQALIIGNTGKQQYALDVERKQYLLHDAPAAPARLEALDPNIAQMVQSQNLSLFLALCGNAADGLTKQASAVTKIDDTTIGKANYPTLKISLDSADLSVAVDSQTHLVRRATIDMTKSFMAQGAQQVKSALLTMEYESTSTAPVDDAKFAWTPPVDSHPFAPPQPQTGDNTDQTQTLVGKPAPAFTATGLDGKSVSDTGLKGSVYILDFWATWCGPCRESLPGLNQIYNDLKDKGLKVFAVNQGEDHDTVQNFVTKTNLTVPALLDTDQKIGQAYFANAIPETVVVGKDGNVAAVFVGGGNEDNIRAAVTAAMK